MKPERIVYTAEACATGSREGPASTPDGRLDVKLAPPGGGLRTARP